MIDESYQRTLAEPARHLCRFLVVLLLLPLIAPTISFGADHEPSTSLLLATTTSVRDSGLLDALLPPFTAETGIEVRAVAVGTGAALRMGAEGNVDLLLTHAPSAEKKLLASGAISERREIMENYFVIAGPAEDSAGVTRAPTAALAMKEIRASRAPFVSRADDSGTHKKEVQLFSESGIDPRENWNSLTRTGSGMGESLLVADQRRAYILSDIGTYLAFRDRIELLALTGPSADLRNVYSVLLVNPARFPRVRGESARRLADYLQSDRAQAIMRNLGRERFGQSLFSPLPRTHSSP